MRTIKFRGKRLDNGEWVYGSLINAPNDMFHEAYISVDEYALFDEKIGFCNDGSVRVLSKTFPVNPKTVGQFTGLLDRHGKEIYEGDIYKKHNNTYLVIWASHGFMWQTIYDNWLNKNIFSRAEKSWLSEIDCKNFIEVIGNIHDNPELIHDQKAEVEHD